MNSTWPVVQGPTRSLYMSLFNRNRCNFRDYQNIAVNGADTNGMLKIMKSLKRDQTADQPMLVVYSLVGRKSANLNYFFVDVMTFNTTFCYFNTF